LRLFSFGGYALALAALALEVFGAYDSYPLAPYFTAAPLSFSDEMSGVENLTSKVFRALLFRGLKCNLRREFDVKASWALRLSPLGNLPPPRGNPLGLPLGVSHRPDT